jgi:hypothetical protein
MKIFGADSEVISEPEKSGYIEMPGRWRRTNSLSTD